MTQFTVKRKTLFGMLVGMTLLLATFDSRIIVISVILWVSASRFRIRKHYSALLVVGLMLLIWMVLNGVVTDRLVSRLRIDVFPVLVVCIFACFRIERSVFWGAFLVLLPIFFLDLSSNFIQRANGVDLFGQVVDQQRNDGTRTTGYFGHSFFSLSIMLSVFLLHISTRSITHLKFPYYAAFLMVGSLRGYVLVLLLTARGYLLRIRWLWAIVVSIIAGSGIYYATYLSVSLGYFEHESGNYFRILAWLNALSEIRLNPIWGTGEMIPDLPADFSVTEDNLIYYRIYESTLLQDAVLYGVPFALLKLSFFFELSRQIYRQRSQPDDSLWGIKRFLAFFLVIDFFVFSFFSMPILTVVISAILFAERPRLAELVPQ